MLDKSTIRSSGALFSGLDFLLTESSDGTV